MSTYKVVYESDGKLAVEKEFENMGDAIKYAGSSKFIRPFVFLDDGTRKLDEMSPEEARALSIQVAGLPDDGDAH